MSRILIIAEHDGQSLNISTAKCVSCAQAIGGDIDIAVIGSGADAVAAEAAALDSVTKVIVVDAEHLEAPVAANWAAEAVALAADYSHVIGPSTTMGRDLMPRIAALAGVNQISDIMEVSGPDSFKRPIYAGNAIVDVSAPAGSTVVATVRAASWKTAGSSGGAALEQRAASSSAVTHTRYIGLESGGGERPDLQSASRVVSGGRGVGSEDGFQVIYQLADKLGAAVGASRAAVDAGYCANDMQVGQTGKIISPDLYMADRYQGCRHHCRR